MSHVAALAPAPVGPLTAGREIQTRFGPIAVDPARTVTIARGLLGFPGRVRFALAAVPERDVPFKLLQALDDPELGFLVLPLDHESGPIARADLAQAARGLGFESQALAAIAIVSLRAESGGIRCTANLKAPVLIDTARRLGAQYVLASDAYQLRHPLPLGSGHAGDLGERANPATRPTQGRQLLPGRSGFSAPKATREPGVPGPSVAGTRLASTVTPVPREAACSRQRSKPSK